MKVLFIRHGKTEGNREGRYVGRTDEPLLEEGKAELSGLLRELQSRGLDSPDKIFISPMKRCVETAEILFPGQPKVSVPGLSECDFGKFEYKNYRELDGDPDYQRFVDSGGREGFPGGEAVEAFKDRCVRAFREILESQETADRTESGAGSEKRELVLAFVVHGGTIMAVMERFGRPRREYFSWQVKNGCALFCQWEKEEEQSRDSRLTGEEEAPWVLRELTAIPGSGGNF